MPIAASDPTGASHACANRLCGRNCGFVFDVSIKNNWSSNFMSHSDKLPVTASKSASKSRHGVTTSYHKLSTYALGETNVLTGLAAE